MNNREEVRAAVTRPSGPRLFGIQYLRALAALMVMYYHLPEQIPAYASALKLHGFIDTDRLATGVDVFFVISGFIMIVTGRNSSPEQFLARRFARIVPLYWIMTLLVACTAIIAPQLLYTTHVTFLQVTESLLFIPYSNADHGGQMWPLLVPGWTLNVEMYFYVIFAITLTVPLRSRQLLAASAIFVALVIANTWISDAHSLQWFYTQPRLLEFLAGMLLARLYVDRRLRLPKSIGVAAVAGGFALLVFGGSLSSSFLLTSCLPAVAVVAGMVGLEVSGALGFSRLFAFFGDASYSIYLTHLFALGLARSAWGALHIGSGPIAVAAFAAISIVLTLAAASASYLLIEKPLLRAFRRFIGEKVREPAAARTVPSPPLNR